jgi:YD repeat-containing protein
MNDTWNYFTGVSTAPTQNRVTYSYNADGMLTQKAYSALRSIIAYSYYPDARLAGMSATTTQSTWGDVVNQPNLYRYAYRNDGLVANEGFGVSNQTVSWSYTRGGRMTALTDFGGSSPSVAVQYGDGHGRISSYTTPSGTYGSFSYDTQGRMTQYTDPYNPVDGETVTSTYNIRGDLVARAFTGGTAETKPGFQYKNVQGVIVQNASDQYDGRTGATLRTYDFGPFTYDQVGRLTNAGGAMAYDAEDRLVSGDTWNASSAADDDCHSGGAVSPNVPPTKELSYLYDAAGQVFQDTVPGRIIMGHQLPPQTRQWFWSASKPLYTVAVGSNVTFRGVQGFEADGLGPITADGSSPGLTIADHDFDGAIAQYHNTTGHSSWAATNPYNQFCQHASPLPASGSYSGPNSDTIPADTSSDPSLTVSSTGRAYLSRSMGFTTPDYTSVTPYAAPTRGLSNSRTGCPEGYHWDPWALKCAQDPLPFEAIQGIPDPFGRVDWRWGEACFGMELASTCLQIAIDSCSRIYASPPGQNFSMGKTPFAVSIAGGIGQVTSKPNPTPEDIRGVVSQWSYSWMLGVVAGPGGGGNLNNGKIGFPPYPPIPQGVPQPTAPNNKTFGGMTPQAGGSVGYMYGPLNKGKC